MSLEQAILDRLEKRNGQIAQLQGTVHALERAADSQREHAILERGRLLEENKKLAAQIESDEKVSQSNQEHAQYQIASLTAEVARLRAEVPLESTREELKNAVAKLQQYKNDVAKLYEIADEIGRGTDESIADVMKRQGTRIAGLVTKLQEVTTDRDRLQNEIDALNRETQTVRERNGSLNSTLVTIGSEVAKEWHL